MHLIHLIDNPLNGILPNFSVFGVQFTQLWQKLVGGMWALAIVAAVVYLIIGISSMATATAGSNPMEYKVGRTKAVWSAIALAALAALAVIVGGILSIVG
jgi:uncharacterized membrane protein